MTIDTHVQQRHLTDPAEVSGGGAVFEGTDDRERANSIVPIGGVALLGSEVAAEKADDYIEVSGGRRLYFVSYFDGDPRFATLTTTITQRRQERYKDEGLLDKDAAAEDDIRGRNVEIVALLDEQGNPVASLRKIHAARAAEIEWLPSYKKFIKEKAFSEAGLDLLRARAEERPVVEIAALWKGSDYSTDTKVALYRRALQESVARNELWFMGIVTPEFQSLRRAYGDQIVRTIGSPIGVKGEHASEKVRIRPVVVDPATFYDDLLDEIDTAQENGDLAKRYAREIMLWHFLAGLDWRQLQPTTVRRLEELSHG